MYCGYLLGSTIRVIRKCCDDTLKEKENRNHTTRRLEALTWDALVDE